MWWKIYFWIIVLLQIVTLCDAFFLHAHEINIFILLHLVVYYLEIIGLFSYLFTKRIFTQSFWRYFFWIVVVLESCIYLYALFPQIPFLSLLHVFFLQVSVTYVTRMVGALIDILLLQMPILYGIYRLSEDKFYEVKVKQKKVIQASSEKKRFQWGMLQMALWGYASVIILFFFIISLFPQGGSDKTSDHTYFVISLITTTIFTPIFIFWLWVVIQYKRYQWNWWRTTLVANALLYSGLTFFGIFSQQTNHPDSSGFDFIGMFQLLVLLVSLYVFGRDQFHPPKRVKQKRTGISY